MIDKERVKNNFSKNASTYDRYAQLQESIASDLVKYLPSGPLSKILEIGAGTGIFTKKLVEKKYKCDIIINDISEEMLKINLKKHKQTGITAYIGDAEKILYNEKYDLIVSNATFQWFADVGSALRKFHKLLNSNGEIVFSIFARDTYKELRETTLYVFGDNQYTQNFISAKELGKICLENNWNYNIDEKHFREEFVDFYSYLKKIKKLGTSSGIKKNSSITLKCFKEMEKYYTDNFSKNNKIFATNHIIYCKIKRKN